MKPEAISSAPASGLVHNRNSDATLLNHEGERSGERVSQATLLNADDELYHFRFSSFEIKLDPSVPSNENEASIPAVVAHSRRTLSPQEELRNFRFPSFEVSLEPGPVQIENTTEHVRVSPGKDVEKQDHQHNQYPEGGLEAVIVLAGAFGSVMASVGWVNSVGVLQEYYQSHQLRDHSASSIAWISSFAFFMLYFWAPLVGSLTDNHGPRVPLVIGSILHVGGLLCTSFSSKYYQIFLSQGVLSATGCSFLYYPATTACATWYLRRRAFAMGIVAAGAAIGGLLFPIIMNRLIVRVGFPWALRTIASILLVVVSFSTLAIRSRLSPLKKRIVFMEFLTPYTEATFLLMTIGAWLMYIGGFIPVIYLTTQARLQGMSIELSRYLVSILSGVSIFGRVIPAYFGDKIGVFNVMIIWTTFGGIATLALWLPSSGLSADYTRLFYIVFAVMYGFASGCFFSILPAMVARISDIKHLGTRTGSAFVVCSTGGLIGSPIAGLLAKGTASDSVRLSIFCAVFLFAGAAVLTLSRVKQTGLRFAAVA